MMHKLGFKDRLKILFFWCISSVSYFVLYNGFPSKKFTSSRGFRQGHLISPFLFLICVEGFSSLLSEAETREYIGVRIGRHVPPVSHLFFADDTLLFTRARETEADSIMEIMTTYELAWGQKNNLKKSEVSFS